MGIMVDPGSKWFYHMDWWKRFSDYETYDLHFNLWPPFFHSRVHENCPIIGVENIWSTQNSQHDPTYHTNRPRIHSTRRSSADDVRHILAGSCWVCVVQGYEVRGFRKLFCLSFSRNRHGPWVHHQMMAIMCLRGVMPISPLWKH